MKFRSGTGFDVHRITQDRPLVIGGVRIDVPFGLDGHSDADVLCHAIMDALLGSVADGDIGRHFPPDDNTWKDADSLLLLGRVSERLRGSKAEIVNVDSTVIAERPRLSGHIAEMRNKLAASMGVETEAVSVKATTCEGLGMIGRGEGIAAMAAVSVRTEE